MSHSLHRVLILAVGAVTVIATGPLIGTAQASDEENGLNGIKHIVVIYEENHSFDNLYGGWEGVHGLAAADAAHTRQIGQGGVTYTCLKQNEVNLTSPPLSATCNDTTTGTAFTSHFTNQPFSIEAYIPASAKTCPPPGVFYPNGSLPGTDGNTAGGCTGDLVHRYYQELYQVNGGAQNRYVTGSDAIGLSMGYYVTKNLPVYSYLHAEDHPSYAISDNFFQAAFGGSFLNHQWLIAARTPVYAGAPASRHSILDSNGMPKSYSLYKATTATVSDQAITQACNLPTTNPNRVCGDFAINTIQPTSQPTGAPAPTAFKLPLLTTPNIGDELSTAGVSWAWYSGGWSDAAGLVGAPGWTNGTTPGTCGSPNAFANPAYPFCPDKDFQFHHQPFNYYANYAAGGPGRSHLQDEQAFFNLAGASEDRCKLNSVSFIKPIGEQNEHPGYTSELAGSTHLVELLKAIQDSACAKDTMVVATYDEFGGSWDHVTPPGQGGKQGPHDVWGPGTRIPTLIVAPHLREDFVVDHTQYDTTSILATIEHRYHLASLGTRDAAANNLFQVFRAQGPESEPGD